MIGSVNVPGTSAADLAKVKKIADDAAAAAGEAKTTASNAQTAAGEAKTAASAAETAASNAQTAAEAALEVITKIANTIAAVPSQSGTLTYNGAAQSPTWNNYDSETLTIGGTTSGTNVGSYNATFTPKEGYQWSDGTTTARTVAWSIGKASLAVPAQSGSLTYTGSAQSPVWNDYDSNQLTIGGAASGTNVGSYNATFTPKEGYQWSDGTTTAKTVSWAINKAAGSVSLSATSLALNGDSPTGSVTVTRAGDGAISATSSNTGVATVSVSGTKVNVTAIADGNITVTVRVAAGTNHNAPANKTFTVAVTDVPHIYGASWDGTSTTKWTRTDDAAGFTDPVPAVNNGSGSSPFDTLQPWAGMVKSERTGGTMVAIPKFWYKLTQNGTGMKIQIADKATSGFSVSPAHMDRGDGKGERDVVYIGRYHCASGTHKSTSGQAPAANVYFPETRTSIHNLGSTIWPGDFALRFTLWLLYLVEFADWDSRGKIGSGYSGDVSLIKNGVTDNMQYHTGTTAASRTTYGYTQYRNIESLWDDIGELLDGCYCDERGLNIILNPNSFGDNTRGISVGVIAGGSVPTAFSIVTAGGFPIFIPTAFGGTDATYTTDMWNTPNSGSTPYVQVGSYYNTSKYNGLFYIVRISVSSTWTYLGIRIQELP